MTTRDLTFNVHWLDWRGEEFATDEIKRHDLSDAITAACGMLKSAKGNARNAHGFMVRRKREPR